MQTFIFVVLGILLVLLGVDARPDPKSITTLTDLAYHQNASNLVIAGILTMFMALLAKD